MDEVPRVTIDEAWQLDEASRRRLVHELMDLGEQINGGEFGKIPSGMPSTKYTANPAPGVVVEVTFTRPGPLP